MADEQSRQRAEINLFAAMALGGENDDFAAPESPRAGSSSPKPQEDAEGIFRMDTPKQGSKQAFVEAASEGHASSANSGTMTFSRTPEASKRSDAEQSNLNAAVAALSGPDLNSSVTSIQTASLPVTSTLNTTVTEQADPRRVKEAEDVPMFAEEVVFSRPLFFGAIIPPRVLLEARSMVKRASEDYKAVHGVEPQVKQLPAAVRNVVGAIRTFGFGLDVMNDINEDQEEFWRGSAKVSTFQPVWGHDRRAERVKEFRKHHRPDIVSRSITAPARLSGTLSVSVSSLPDTEDLLPTSRQESQNNQFSMWIRGDDELSGSFGLSGGESISSVRSLESLTSPSNTVGKETPVDSPEETTKKEPTEIDIFSQMARGDIDGGTFKSKPTEQELFSQMALCGSGTFQANKPSENEQSSQLVEGSNKGSLSQAASEQELFSQWARGPESGTFIGSTQSSSVNESTAAFDPSTFQRTPTLGGGEKPRRDSDGDDSVKEDELKKQVGLSDHLSKAIASLSGDTFQSSADLAVEPSLALLSRVPQDPSAERALTNYELTNGCVPIFGADDKPLPDATDLGIHETKEEQMRCQEMKRSQEIIGRFVPPNVFGTVACPRVNGPHDTHSWNSRTLSARREVLPPSVVSEVGSLKSSRTNGVAAREEHNSTPSGGSSNKQNSLPQPKKKESTKSKRLQSRTRFGWWNVTESTGSPASPSKKRKESEHDKSPGSLHLPPDSYERTQPLVTNLEPSPERLREANIPLSRLHAATTIEGTLPYLSDRSPSHRFLQIDTQAIGFPPIKGEVEPLFCSLTIYNVETVSSAPGGQHGLTPVPDLQRCGRVTETLYFDVVGEQNVAERCAAALWPYAQECSSSYDRLEGTRCGVFPLPSNLSVANLYAVLIVRKVLSEDGDLDPYIRPGKHVLDLEKLRSNAEKASRRHGELLLPFAFGVAPLLQVFGTENPHFATSRAVQIPLFRFKGEERQIIDHIMVMLYPRADHKAHGVGGPAAVTNGGTAMLVMRNFGYLGLHVAVDRKSSLARDRLVDFTGEIQIRRKVGEKHDRNPPNAEENKPAPSFVTSTAGWEGEYTTEPAINGGRNSLGTSKSSGLTHSQYAQELAPLPLRLTAPSVLASPPSVPKGRLHGHDIEPAYYTTFCNELICQPRIIHNCSKRTIIVKVELRELEWNDSFNGYFAHLPLCGPAFHNSRRGPFLVQHVYSACSPRNKSSEHHFVEEFKLKLPLDLKPRRKDGTSRTLSLFFTVYGVKTGAKSKWKRTKGLFNTHESSSDTKARLDQIACGFLPVSSPNCLLDNGLHDVQVAYKARSPPKDLMEQYLLPDTSLLLVERRELQDNSNVGGREDSLVEDTVSYGSNSEKQTTSEAGARTDRSYTSDFSSAAGDSTSKGGKQNDGPLCLSVRIVAHSSLHSQNEALDEFLNDEPDLPKKVPITNSSFLSSIRVGRDALARKTASFRPVNVSVQEDHLIQSTLSLTDPHLSSAPRSSAFLLRTMPVLWRQFVCGNGDAELPWANPSSLIPLRLHSFASILHLLAGACTYFGKNGVTEVDGSRRWNLLTLGRVVALVFDENVLFGEQAVEDVDDEYWATILDTDDKTTKRKSPRKGRHVRNNFELFNEIHAKPNVELNDKDFLSSVAGELAGPARRRSDTDSSPSSISVTGGEAIGEIKVDSKSDFQSFLRAAVADSTGDNDIVQKDRTVAKSGSAAAEAMISSFQNASNDRARRWMTMPAPGGLSTIRESETLSPIRENDDGNNTDTDAVDSFGISSVKLTDLPETGKMPDSIELDHHVAVQKQKKGVKQMRIPQKKQNGDNHGEDAPPSVPFVLSTDEELETAALPFLDVIGQSLGISPSAPDNADEGRRRVGSSHHRKTQSRSSIDWTLIGEDSVISNPVQEAEPAKSVNGEEGERMSTLKKEESSSIVIPTFIDRLAAMGKSSNTSVRWFPYTYEVIITHWAAVLTEQRRIGQFFGSVPDDETFSESLLTDESILTQAAKRSVGVSVAGAPLLFEVIKKSLGFRTAAVFKKVVSKHEGKTNPPLLCLDDTLLSSLENIITMVTDACLDPQNFDSWEQRHIIIDVNDSTVLFLRDLFSFLAPAAVHRLVLAYFARFAKKDSRGAQDKDSKIGVRCSWEITKLRLNAASAMIRFPDLIRVCSPQMLSWDSWWKDSPARFTDDFFAKSLRCYDGFRLSGFVDEDSVSPTQIPSMRPHWLAEHLVDICLIGTEHVEQYIQNRSAALLHELFWTCSHESIFNGTSLPVSSMFFTFLEKILSHVSYLTNFAPKSQLRKDMLPCVVYVLQGAAPGLLRAFWRRLCTHLQCQGGLEKYGLHSGYVDLGTDTSTANPAVNQKQVPKVASETKEHPDAVCMFSLLNLAIRTLEFEGSEEHIELENSGESRENMENWRQDYLLSPSNPGPRPDSSRTYDRDPGKESKSYTSSVSRRWQSHDGSMVIVNTVHHIVLEMYTLLKKSPKGKSFLNPAVNRPTTQQATDHDSEGDEIGTEPCHFSYLDVVLFVRAGTSVYLHALSLQESDLVVTRALKLTAEVIKMFGIRIFLEAVEETLQHWMRVILFHCGARRASVRIESTDILELILRSAWECFGSFFRIRVPLLAVQTEVMERIVAMAAARYYREYRRRGTSFEPFSNVSAEASLAPLWRTLDRIETQPASRNVGFRGALIRMAGKLKRLYRAYVAARVLSFIHGSQNNKGEEPEARDFNTEARVRADRIVIMRVLNASGGHSKQFLGFQGTRQHRSGVAHYEAVEDALMDAADVFSPTELPEHRVAWLRMLADFHKSRKKFAEEASCHFQIHVTLCQAAKLHGALWSNTPFLPWTDSMPDPVYIDGDAPSGDAYDNSDMHFEDNEAQYSRGIDNPSSFRRIFYRVANSVPTGNTDWETGASKTLFCGVALSSEYSSVGSWISLKEMEENMVEEAEAAGELFLEAGIIENSRLAWSMATQYYAEKFNYAKLSLTYGNLARAIISQVPPVDSSLPQEISAALGRFYRVWFHGGAPDELSGVEFVYRTAGSVCLDDFGENLKEVIKSIMPDNTPIHLLLDGRKEERTDEGSVPLGFSRIGPAPLAPVKVKVTPLRPLYSERAQSRGLPEWFHQYVDQTDLKTAGSSLYGNVSRRSDSMASLHSGTDPHNREHTRSLSAFSTTIFSANRGGRGGSRSARNQVDRPSRLASSTEGELHGVDRFCFLQARDRNRGSKEWWKTSSGSFVEKSLMVRQLQVRQPFPACVARQAVIHRLAYSTSPLEAGVDALCQWCSLLFRTAVATVGMSVLGTNSDPGIGTDAAKVVADSVHSSQVKEMGLYLLQKYTDRNKDEDDMDFALDYDRLVEDEMKKLQLKLARLVVVFLELLHVLIARNRDVLLEVIHERKNEKKRGESTASRGGSSVRCNRRTASVGGVSIQSDTSDRKYPASTSSVSRKAGPKGAVHKRNITAGELKLEIAGDIRSKRSSNTTGDDQQTVDSTKTGTGGLRTDSAIAVQSELQRALTNLSKTLYPRLQGILHSQTPRWLKQCSQENYFSMGYYKQTKIPIAEELFLSSASDSQGMRRGLDTERQYDAGYESPRGGSIGGGSAHSIVSRGSERYGLGQF